MIYCLFFKLYMMGLVMLLVVVGFLLLFVGLQVAGIVAIGVFLIVGSVGDFDWLVYCPVFGCNGSSGVIFGLWWCCILLKKVNMSAKSPIGNIPPSSLNKRSPVSRGYAESQKHVISLWI